MTNRRSLVEGMKPGGGVDPAAEAAFIYGTPPARSAAAPAPPTTQARQKPRHTMPPAERDQSSSSALTAGNRLPITTRLRADLAGALKRASLERQLAGIEPYTLQDLIEEALEPWLRAHGYLA